MGDHWQPLLRTARDRLIRLSNGSGLRCLLVYREGLPFPAVPEPEILDDLLRLNSPPSLLSGFCHRDVAFLVHPDGSPVYADKVTYDLNGKPMVAPDGRPYAVQLPAVSTIYLYGNSDAATMLRTIGAGLGAALLQGMRVPVPILPKGIGGEKNAERWLFLLFELAWRAKRGELSGIAYSAERMIWLPIDPRSEFTMGDGFRTSLADLDKLRSGKLDLPFVRRAVIPESPGWFYAILEDVVSAAINAIDFILATNPSQESQGPTGQPAAGDVPARRADAGTKRKGTANQIKKAARKDLVVNYCRENEWDGTLPELRKALVRDKGLRVSISTLCRYLQGTSFAPKGNPHRAIGRREREALSRERMPGTYEPLEHYTTPDDPDSDVA